MADEKEPTPPSTNSSLFSQGEKIEKINVADEIKNSFLDYSMSVIIARALPDARDGLKPSQRRILYAMHDLSLYPGRQHRKCAKICGDTSGNYHPHGEAVIYPTLVHMAQPWSMREPLVDGQGNFGSVEGDPPAAMRYTEARLTHLGSILMDDMDRDTIDFVANYDNTRTEPVVFPAAFPNLLVNGGTGIAVGMATNIAPHNLSEIVDGICAQIDNPDITVEELMKHVKGPDFPTGCIVCGLSPIKEYLSTGRGSLKVRGRAGVEELKGGKEQIVITEIPYGVNRALLVEKIAALVNEKIITEISAIRDESDENTRVVIELKRDALPKVVINQLYKYTQLETTFAVNMLAIDHGRPKLMGLKDLNHSYIEHRREVVIRRTKFDLKKAQDRAHILEGYIIAIDNINAVIRIIREAENRDDARMKLMERFTLSEVQANAILEMRLYQLTGLERIKVDEELAEVRQTIERLKGILASELAVMNIIKEELLAIKTRYGSERRTQLAPDEGEINLEDLIANESAIITITHAGYIKRTATSAYRAQRRGGKGVIGMDAKDDDFIEHMFTATTHDFILFFSTMGQVYVEKVYDIPEMGRAAKGRSIANLLELQDGEKIAALICIKEFSDKHHLVMATENGITKKTNLADYANAQRKGGVIGIRLEDNDHLVGVQLTNGDNEIVLVSKHGMSIRFHEEQLRDQGRDTVGVYGMDLEKDDHVVAIEIVNPHATLLVAGENGIGKRTEFGEYRSQSRGGKGIITMKTGDKTGFVVGALSVIDIDQIMLSTAQGQTVRTHVKDIRSAGRNTQGVKLIDLAEGDKLSAIAKVVPDGDEEENAAEVENSEKPGTE